MRFFLLYFTKKNRHLSTVSRGFDDDWLCSILDRLYIELNINYKSRVIFFESMGKTIRLRYNNEYGNYSKRTRGTKYAERNSGKTETAR
jgi:hypothetical protein